MKINDELCVIQNRRVSNPHDNDLLRKLLD